MILTSISNCTNNKVESPNIVFLWDLCNTR